MPRSRQDLPSTNQRTSAGPHPPRVLNLASQQPMCEACHNHPDRTSLRSGERRSRWVTELSKPDASPSRISARVNQRASANSPSFSVISEVWLRAGIQPSTPEERARAASCGTRHAGSRRPLPPRLHVPQRSPGSRPAPHIPRHSNIVSWANAVAGPEGSVALEHQHNDRRIDPWEMHLPACLAGAPKLDSPLLTLHRTAAGPQNRCCLCQCTMALA